MGEEARDETDDIVEFVERLIELDMALTGRDYRDASGAFNEQRGIATGGERFARETQGCRAAYYLSDMGRSRLYCEGAELRLSPSSTDAVKARWDECRAERERVEEMLPKVAASEGSAA